MLNSEISEMDDDDKYEVTDEQRRSNVLKLRKLIWDINENAEKKRTRSLRWKQIHNPKALLRALETFREDE